LYGLSFLVAMLLCSGEASAQQITPSLATDYSLILKDPMGGKTPKAKQDAMTSLMAQVAVYRSGYPAQQGTDNEALHLLRIDYFTGIAKAIDGGMDFESALNRTAESTLLAEARNYSTAVVNGAALDQIYKEAIALVSL